MNVSASSSAISEYSYYLSISSSDKTSGGVSQEVELACASAKVADYEDILDLSPQALEAADNASTEEAEATSADDQAGIDRFDLSDLWREELLVSGYLQLGNSIQSDDNAYFERFDVTIEMAEKELQQRIDSLLEMAEIELAEGERFDIHVDEDGVINVSLPVGEDSEARAEEIALVLNADETLAHDLLRIRALRNTRDSVLGLEAVPDTLRGGVTVGKESMPDLTTRRFLAEDYLQREFEVSLDDLSVNGSSLQILGQEGSTLEQELNENLAIQEEMITVLQNLDQDLDLEFTADFSFGDGVLLDSEEVDEIEISENLRELFTAGGTMDHPKLEFYMTDNLANALDVYNKTAPEDRIISNFSIILDDQGDISIEGEFTTGESLGTARRMIESWFTPTFEALAEVTSDAILHKHDAEHGDVDEYEHEVELKVDIITGITAEVRSEEADLAALEDLAATVEEVGESFGQFVHETYQETYGEMTPDEFQTIFSEPVEVNVSEDGRLMIDEATIENQRYLQVIRDSLAVLNDVLDEEEYGTSSASRLESLSLRGQATVELLKEVRDTMNRIHDPSLRWAAFTFAMKETA